MANKCFSKFETYNLKPQILSSSRSITANIADGFGRFHHQENIQFCRQARGFLSETLEHAITAFDENYIDKTDLEQIHAEYQNCLKEINAYIKYLKTAKAIINNK